MSMSCNNIRKLSSSFGRNKALIRPCRIGWENNKQTQERLKRSKKRPFFFSRQITIEQWTLSLPWNNRAACYWKSNELEGLNSCDPNWPERLFFIAIRRREIQMVEELVSYEWLHSGLPIFIVPTSPPNLVVRVGETSKRGPWPGNEFLVAPGSPRMAFMWKIVITIRDLESRLQQTSNCTTGPSFPFTCPLLSIISTRE